LPEEKLDEHFLFDEQDILLLGSQNSFISIFTIQCEGYKTELIWLMFGQSVLNFTTGYNMCGVAE